MYQQEPVHDIFCAFVYILHEYRILIIIRLFVNFRQPFQGLRKSICGKFKIRFGQTFVVAQIEKVSGIDARLTQLEACHVQKVADIERDLQTMVTLMLVGSDEQQAFIHQIFFVQRRTGKNDGQCFFFRHG